MTDVLQPQAPSGEAAGSVGASGVDAPTAAGPAKEATVQAPTHMTFDEFMAYDPETGRAEWVDGEVLLVSPAASDHQFLVGFLYRLLSDWVESHELGFVLLAPLLMRLANRPSGREPDILFVTAEHADRVKPTYLDGPADLVIEVVSPDSEARDHVDKRNEYEAAKIPEYWVLDRLRQNAFFYLLGDDGYYHPAPIDQDGIYRSRVLEGFRLRVDWLWRQPLPKLAEALRELPA